MTTGARQLARAVEHFLDRPPNLDVAEQLRHNGMIRVQMSFLEAPATIKCSIDSRVNQQRPSIMACLWMGLEGRQGVCHGNSTPPLAACRLVPTLPQ
jgi:hypothetical protein